MYKARWSDISGSYTQKEKHGSLLDVVNWAGQCRHINGPNGPLSNVILYRPDGSRVESWKEELENNGLVPLWIQTYTGSWRIIGARSC